MADAPTLRTTDHATIRRWAEARKARPMAVEDPRSPDVPSIRLSFPDARTSDGGSLTEIAWDEWLRRFDEAGLVFVYRETEPDGSPSRFNRLERRVP